MGIENESRKPENLQIVELTLAVYTGDEENVSLKAMTDDLMAQISGAIYYYELLEAKQVKKIAYGEGLNGAISNGDTC
jgi:hypothetical protein